MTVGPNRLKSFWWKRNLPSQNKYSVSSMNI
jgi:hypothetical protein